MNTYRAIPVALATSLLLTLGFVQSASATYEACTPSEAPFLTMKNLPKQIAYGRTGWVVVTRTEGIYYPDEASDERLTIQAANETTPLYEYSGEGVFEEHAFEVGHSSTELIVTLAYVEHRRQEVGAIAVTEPATCERVLSKNVQLGPGYLPEILHRSFNEGTVKLTLRSPWDGTHRRSCEEMRLGSIVLLVHGPGGSRKLTLSDVCEEVGPDISSIGDWSRRVRGHLWELAGDGDEADLNYEYWNAPVGHHPFIVSALSGGKAFWRVRVTFAVHDG
jgi:hypothetical protein